MFGLMIDEQQCVLVQDVLQMRIYSFGKPAHRFDCQTYIANPYDAEGLGRARVRLQPKLHFDSFLV
jgi:hypothetical protein